jgi:hypothetical protein
MHRLTNVYRTQYNASSKKEKSYWVHRVIREIRESGGRFLQLTSSPVASPNAIDSQVPTPSKDFCFELVDDMTAYKKVSHAFRSKGRTKVLVSTPTTMMQPSSLTVGNDDRKPAARSFVDSKSTPPVGMPSELVAGIPHAQNQQHQQHWTTNHDVQQASPSQQQWLQQPQSGITGGPNMGLALESTAGGLDPIRNVVAALMLLNQFTSPQFLTEFFAMRQVQQILALNPGLATIVAPPNLSGGTVQPTLPLEQNMLLALLVLMQQQSQQQQVVQQPLSPVHTLLSLMTPSFSLSSNILPQHGMSVAMIQLLLQLLQANMVSPVPPAPAAAAPSNINSDNNPSEQSRDRHENQNDSDSSQL